MQRVLRQLRPVRLLYPISRAIPPAIPPAFAYKLSAFHPLPILPIRAFTAVSRTLSTVDTRHIPLFSVHEAVEESNDEDIEELIDRANYPELFPDSNPIPTSAPDNLDPAPDDLNLALDDPGAAPHSDADDAWFVDPAYDSLSASDFVPLWQRRAETITDEDIVGRRKRADVIPMTLPSVVELLEQSKLENVRVIDMRQKCDWTDYMIVAESEKGERYLTSVADEVMTVFKHSIRKHTPQLPLPTIEGRDKSADWLLIDVGPYIIHLFTPEARRNYDLETLWDNVPDDPLIRLTAPDVSAEELLKLDRSVGSQVVSTEVEVGK
ncbi:hypothetical protein BC938DRAFT_481919 [Jimgerdemannia flammicorona]|uniref:Oligomerization domain-containing protein n=1 Tax=Jimgerdemannia flammicorona TaxID=994334 RepID=A0A433QF08_9FUNG|nr:hypothetical protein BC938DRAFT_481919 [Jimgerdemannia flammicorona]